MRESLTKALAESVSEHFSRITNYQLKYVTILAGGVFCSALAGIAILKSDIMAPSPAPVVAATPTITPSAASPVPSPAYPMAVEMEVRAGDTLLTMLTDSKVKQDEAYNVVETLRKIYNPRQMNIGQSLSLNLDKSHDNADATTVKTLAIEVSPFKTIKLTRGPNGEFKVSQVDLPLEKNLARGGGLITSSLYETALASGMPLAAVNDLIQAFSYDVDFQRDIKDGAKLDVLYERLETPTGHLANSGKVLYAKLDLGKRNVEIFRYTDKSGTADYYDGKGESVRKAMLKTPINGARITSRFGMRRHPLLGYTKMHKGIDFGAASGTPVYAAGDGVVGFASTKGGYGNYLMIKHTSKYASAYGHLSRFGKGIRPGVKVRQGQVVAYVGSTGASTGPHLHYEIMVNGAQVNPSNVKFRGGNQLAGKELTNFKVAINSHQKTVASLHLGQKISLASNKASPSAQAAR